MMHVHVFMLITSRFRRGQLAGCGGGRRVGETGEEWLGPPTSFKEKQLR